MAEIDTQLRKSIEESIQANRSINREMSQAIKTVTKFTDALDVASNTAIDKSTDSLKQLLKTSKLLADSQVDTIKSAKGLQNVVESLGRKQARLDELQEQYNKHLQKAIANGHTGVKLQRVEAILQQRLAKRLNDLGVSSASAANASAKLQDELIKHKDLEKQLNKEIANLTSSASKAGKAVEDLGSRMLETAEKHLSVISSIGLLQKSLTELYGQVSRFADKGMFAAWRAINMGALRLKLSVAEFEEVMARNMDIVNSLGGGIAGIDSFTEALQSASKDLEMYGKNSAKIAAAIMGTVQRTTGLGPGSRDSLQSRESFNQIQKTMKDQFKLFNGGFGDTIEQFTTYYDQVLRSEELQSKMNGLDSKGITNMVTEIQIRTENLKLMGLNNEQILEMTKRMEQVFPRLQNNQGDAISKGINASNTTALLGQFAQSQGLGELGSRLQSKEYTDFARKIRMSDAQTANNLLATQFGQQYSKDMADARGELERARQKDEAGSAGSFKGYAAVAAIQRDPQFLDAIMDHGTNINIAKRSGQDHTEDAYTDKDGRIVGGAADKFRKDIKDMSGEADMLGKSFATLRSTVDQINSILNGGNGFIMGLGAAAAAALLFSSALRGKVLGAIGTFASTLMGKAVPGGGLAANVGTIMPKIAKYAKGIGGGLTAALGANEAYQAYQSYERGDIDEAERNKRYGSAIGSTVGAIGGGFAGVGIGSVGTSIAGGLVGDKAGGWLGEKTGEKGKYKAKPVSENMNFGELLNAVESGKRGYNSYNRGWTSQAASNKENIDLSKMTLNEIRERQMLPEGHKDRLFAVGKYQIVGSKNKSSDTMGSAIKTLGLTGNEYFTPQLQDYIAANFLTGSKRPSLNAFVTGKSNNLNAAINDAAYEWAALQTTSGVGAYDKQGNNHASVPPSITGKILTKARETYLNAIQGGKTPAQAKSIALGFLNNSGITKNVNQTQVASNTSTVAPSNVNTSTINPPKVASTAVNTSPVSTSTVAPPNVNTSTINPPKVASTAVNTSPVSTLTTPTTTQTTSANIMPTSNTAANTQSNSADMAKVLAPILGKIAENTTPSILYDQRNYKPSQDTAIGAM